MTWSSSNCCAVICSRSWNLGDAADCDEQTELRIAVLHLYILNSSSLIFSLINCAWNSCVIVCIFITFDNNNHIN